MMNIKLINPHKQSTVCGGVRISEVIAALLILLFVYAALSKLIDYDHARGQMLSQVFPNPIGTVLVWAVPVTELVTAGLLLFDRTRSQGLYLSLALISAFTIYIGLVLLHVFSRVPCSCGGVLSHMGWLTLFFFNLFILAITVTAIFLQQQKRKGCQ